MCTAALSSLKSDGRILFTTTTGRRWVHLCSPTASVSHALLELLLGRSRFFRISPTNDVACLPGFIDLHFSLCVCLCTHWLNVYPLWISAMKQTVHAFDCAVLWCSEENDLEEQTVLIFRSTAAWPGSVGKLYFLSCSVSCILKSRSFQFFLPEVWQFIEMAGLGSATQNQGERLRTKRFKIWVLSTGHLTLTNVIPDWQNQWGVTWPHNDMISLTWNMISDFTLTVTDQPGN